MTAVVIVNFLLQSALFQFIEILGVRPDTALVFIASYAILRGDVEGAALGFGAGFLRDAYYGPYIGLHSLLYMLTGFVCGKPFKNFFRENFFLPLILTFVCSMLYQSAYYVVNFMFLAEGRFLFYMTNIILPHTVYTLLLTVPVYSIMYELNNKLESYEKNGRKTKR
jgi:rod shape-determining protein MreD